MSREPESLAILLNLNMAVKTRIQVTPVTLSKLPDQALRVLRSGPGRKVIAAATPGGAATPDGASGRCGRYRLRLRGSVGLGYYCE